MIFSFLIYGSTNFNVIIFSYTSASALKVHVWLKAIRYTYFRRNLIELSARRLRISLFLALTLFQVLVGLSHVVFSPHSPPLPWYSLSTRVQKINTSLEDSLISSRQKISGHVVGSHTTNISLLAIKILSREY